MNEERLKIVWQTLKDKGINAGEFNDFKQDLMDDPIRMRKVHSTLLENGVEAGKYGDFLYDLDFSETPKLSENPAKAPKEGEKNVLPLGVLQNTWVGDWMDDMFRGLVRGSKSGDAIPETFALMLGGADVSEESIKKFIEAQEKAQEYGPSDEMNEFMEAGGLSTIEGWGTLAANALTIVPEIIGESLSAMLLNTTTGTVIGGAAAATIATGGGAISAIPAAMGFASGALESTGKFAQTVQEEIYKKGLRFDEEGVRTILEDEDAFGNIVRDSLAKGITIGMIDYFTGRMASKLGVKAAKLKEAGEAGVKKTLTKAALIESTGGGVGEALGEIVSGEPLDITNIGLEFIADAGQGGINTGVGYLAQKFKSARNLSSDSVNEEPSPADRESASTEPKYVINGETVSREEYDRALKLYEDANLKPSGKVDFLVENDEDLIKRTNNVYGRTTEPGATTSSQATTSEEPSSPGARGSDTTPPEQPERPESPTDPVQQGEEPQSNVQGDTGTTVETPQTPVSENPDEPVSGTTTQANVTPDEVGDAKTTVNEGQSTETVQEELPTTPTEQEGAQVLAEDTPRSINYDNISETSDDVIQENLTSIDQDIQPIIEGNENPNFRVSGISNPITQVGDKYYVTKKDGTPSKKEVKNPKSIQQYKDLNLENETLKKRKAALESEVNRRVNEKDKNKTTPQPQDITPKLKNVRATTKALSDPSVKIPKDIRAGKTKIKGDETIKNEAEESYQSEVDKFDSDINDLKAKRPPASQRTTDKVLEQKIAEVEKRKKDFEKRKKKYIDTIVNSEKKLRAKQLAEGYHEGKAKGKNIRIINAVEKLLIDSQPKQTKKDETIRTGTGTQGATDTTKVSEPTEKGKVEEESKKKDTEVSRGIDDLKENDVIEFTRPNGKKGKAVRKADGTWFLVEGSKDASPTMNKFIDRQLRKKFKNGESIKVVTIEEDAGVKGPPPPGTPVPDVDSGPPANTKESDFGKRLRDKGENISAEFQDEIVNITVLQQANDISFAKADTVIDQIGEDAALKIVTSPATLSDTVRVTIGMRLIKRWSEMADRATDPDIKNTFYDKSIQALDETMALANDIGRALQMFRMWRYMGAEGYARYAFKAGQTIKRNVEKKYATFINDMKDANREAIENAARKAIADMAGGSGIDRAKLLKIIKDSIGKDLSLKIQKELGLSKERSDKLANQITESFNKLYKEEFKRKAINRLPRKLREFRKLIDSFADDPTLTDDMITAAILKELDIELNLTAEQIAKMRERLARMSELPESPQLRDEAGRQALEMIHDLFGDNAEAFLPKNSRDSLGWGLFYASILSGPRTQALNLGINMVKLISDNIMASISAYQRTPAGRERFGIAMSNWLGLWQGLMSRGFVEGKEILYEGRKKTDRSSKFMDSSELERWGREWRKFNDIAKSKDPIKEMTKNIAFVAKYVPRLMSAVDTAFYWSNYFGKMRMIMAETKLDSSLKGKAFRNAVNEAMFGGKLQIQNAEIQALSELKRFDPIKQEALKREFDALPRNENKDIVDPVAIKKANELLNKAEFMLQVSGEKFTEVDIRRRKDEILQGILIDRFGNDAVEDADRFAKNATFQQEPQGVMGSLARTIQSFHASKNPAAAIASRLIVPFTRIVANVTNDQLDYVSIVGIPRGLGWVSSSELTAEERQIAFNKGMTGIALGIIAAALFWQFDPEDDDALIRLHGRGPDDFQKLLILKQTNWQPNSIQIGDKYISVGETPFGLLLTIFGNTFDGVRYNKEANDATFSLGARAAIDAFLSSPQVLLEASFLSGAARFFETVIAPSNASPEKRAENMIKWVADQPKVIIPQAFRQVGSALDPTWYQTNGLGDYFYKQYALPFLQLTDQKTDRLMPYMTALGDDISFGRNSGTLTPLELSNATKARLTGVSRFVNIKVKDQPVYDLLLAKNVYPSALGYNTVVNGEVLYQTDRRKFNEVAKIRGQLLKQYIKDNLERLQGRTRKEIDEELRYVLDSRRSDSITNIAKGMVGLPYRGSDD